ncbi:MAG: glycosyltransferase family 2 protein [Candidatus Saccharibacteria bacterium]|nr:glycosyltransferase family 2 protein [Candidatus Saccharibacteria bacterium]
MIKRFKEMVPLCFRLRKHRYEYFHKHNEDSVRNVFEKQERMGVKNIPIFLISFNRLSFLQSMIKRLEEMDVKNIYIIDNFSSYPPLLDFYKSIPYKVFYMKKNEGQMVFWNNPLFDEYRKGFYVVSDPDIEPVENCPNDFIERFFYVLKKYPFVKKVGFSLKIDDLPVNNPMSESVAKWEKRFSRMYIKEDNAYYAPIDTTFALYVPDSICTHRFGEAFRLGYPYQARHTPWYKDPTEVTDEDRYYVEHKTNGWWNVVEGKMTPDKLK